ncbi:MAG: hypothetical protein IE928_09550, partial [Gammaproteobacteria bacterium]|nr:hypothetical protein [Gammaproteobacteria bacterium]MBD3815847.1 hypothetical protein [Halothiobacillus sp.]
NVTREQDRVGEVSTLFAGGWGGQTAAQQTGADGSAYTITTAEQLQNINLVASDGFDYKLSNYIDLTAITNWTPIGNDTTKFTGNFDGLGNTISNLGVTGGNYLGLFGYTLGANIENLTLDGVNIVSTGGWLGGLAGRADNTSIRNVSVTGISEISSTLTGDVRAGGLVGLLLGNSSLETVSSSATVTAADGNRVGGLVGESVNNSGTVNVSQATATGVTTGKERVGGLIGYANVGTNISNSSATGDVYGLTSVGGLVGFLNRSTILNSTASGDVIGRLVDNGSSGFVTVSKLGGLVGSTSFDAARSSIEDSHATGAVRLEQANPDANLINGFGTFGGLVGEAAYTDISDSTASGTVSAIKSSGGLVGQLLAESTITASQASGAVIQLVSSTSKNRIGGLVGYVGADGVIDQSSASGEIQLQSGAYEVGGLVGRADNGVQISQSHATGNIIGGANSSDIGGLAGDLNSAQVSGSYAVNTITLSENARSVGGLVGIGTGSSVITQSYANTGITTTNAGTYIGGLVGDFSGNEISESYATGTVAVSDNALQIGGLAGYASSASITNAYSTAALTVGDTASNIGGLVGQLSTNTVANAYATGAIAVGVNSTQVGGLIGTNGDATGANVTNSYWDTTTSGKITSAGGTGKTSAELQSLATYGSAGWSIDDQGGSANVWRIYEGYTNPLLRTFMTALTVSSLKDGKTYDAQTVTDVNDVAVLAGTYDNQHIFTVGDVVGKKDVGTYSFNIYSDQMGYDLIGTRTNNFVITKADLIVTGGSAANKVYDGTTVATVTGGVVNALLNDEVVLSDANATFADKNVGDGKAVTTAYTISGADAGNYNLIQQAGLTADITPATQVNTAVSDVQNSVSNPIQPPVVPAPTPLTLTLGDAGSTQMIGGLQVVEVTVEPGQAGGAYGGMLAGGLGNGAGNASGMQTVFVVNGGIRMPNASLNTEE